ncbi:hypothetical protein F6455_04640 [Proteobacteria bacterium 005FR1]|nr:hypothetical protein [Proteobacteria bacterium 005FR1]
MAKSKAKDQLYAAIANQKLAFARQALSTAAAQDDETINGRLARHAHLDAAILELCSGVSYFVAEVAEQYGLSVEPGLRSPVELLEMFAGSGRQNAAVAELHSLRKRPDSWFADLLETAANPLSLVQRFKAEDSFAAVGAPAEGGAMIPVLDVTHSAANAPDLSPVELVSGWARAAQELVDRQRAALHEE